MLPSLWPGEPSGRIVLIMSEKVKKIGAGQEEVNLGTLWQIDVNPFIRNVLFMRSSRTLQELRA